MSRVFLAEETRLSRQVVIKVLPPEMGAGVNAERFEQEIRLAARLQHPHIVPLLTAGASGDLLYYIMPFIAGESLRAKLAREGELPVTEVVRVLREVTEARGDRRQAADNYNRFVDLWKNADPELQPAVREVRARLAQLAREPGG